MEYVRGSTQLNLFTMPYMDYWDALNLYQACPVRWTHGWSGAWQREAVIS